MNVLPISIATGVYEIMNDRLNILILLITTKGKIRMSRETNSRKRFAALMDEVANSEGIHPTLIDGVRVARHSCPLPRTSVVYAARAVGYESASQFSREFKRLFGETPMEGLKRMRQVDNKITGRGD